MPLDGASWSTACPDWWDRLQAGRLPVPDLPLFDPVADKAVRIFKRLRVPDMMGKPRYGEVCAPWVFDLVRVIFGSLDPETKVRLITEFFVLIPKKNGKSAIAAGIIVTAALMNERPAAELLLVAPTKDIAKIAFKQARGIIKADPELRKRFHIADHELSIRHLVTEAVIWVKAADLEAVTGSKAAYVLIDETHEFAGDAKAEGVFTELRGGLAARPEGFLLQISTQSKAPPAGVFKAELDQARRVRDGLLELPVLAVIYELPVREQMRQAWKDPATWAHVNPSLGRSVQERFLRTAFQAALDKGPEALALFASQHLNVEIGLGLRAESWIGARFWLKRQAPEFADLRGREALEVLLARSEVAVAGIDGGGLDDLMGLAVMGRERDRGRWLLWAHAWAHAEVLDKRKEIAPRLLDFQRAGDLTVIGEDDPTGDVHGVGDLVERLLEAGLLPDAGAVGLDPYGISAVLDELAVRGLEDKQLVGIGQGAKLSPAVWGMERKLKDGTLVHAGQPLMAWCLGNAKSVQRGSAVLITKETAGKAKIDPLIAAFNAFQLMSRNPEAAGGSYLETGALLVA